MNSLFNKLSLLLCLVILTGCRNTSLDHEPPRFISSSPSPYGIVPYNNRLISLYFSETIDPDSTITIRVEDEESNEKEGTLSILNNAVIYELDESFSPHASYSVVIEDEDGIQDLAGNSLVFEIEDFSFETTDYIDDDFPKVLSTMPSQGADQVGVRSEIVLNYNRDLVLENNGSGLVQLTNVDDSSELEVSIRVEGTQIFVTPLESMRAQSVYTLSWGTQVRSTSGAQARESGTLTFKTGDRDWGTPALETEDTKSIHEPKFFQFDDGTEVWLYVLGTDTGLSEVYVRTKNPGDDEFGTPLKIFETFQGGDSELVDMKFNSLRSGEILIAFLVGTPEILNSSKKISSIHRDRNGVWGEVTYHDRIHSEDQPVHWSTFLASDGNGMIGWVDPHLNDNDQNPTFYIEKMIDGVWPDVFPDPIQTLLDEDSSFSDIQVVLNNGGNAVAMSIYYDAAEDQNRILFKKSLDQGHFAEESIGFMNEHFPESDEPQKFKAFLRSGNQNILFVLFEINGSDRLRYYRFTDNDYDIGQSGWIDLPSHQIEDFWYVTQAGRESLLTYSRSNTDFTRAFHVIDREQSVTGEFTEWNSTQELYSANGNYRDAELIASPRGDRIIVIQTSNRHLLSFDSPLDSLHWDGTGSLNLQDFDIGSVYGISGIQRDSGETTLTFKTATSAQSTSGVNHYTLTK